MSERIKISGTVDFAVKGQAQLPKWQREAIANGLKSEYGPPESLRFNCRMAEDARENFKEIIDDQERVWTLHPNGNPQFGRNVRGEPYLTVTLQDEAGDGYKFRWAGDAVPKRMAELAVRHDEGREVAPSTIRLSLARAEVAPSHQSAKVPYRKDRDNSAEWKRRKALRESGEAPRKRAPRKCGRITRDDLS